MVGGRDRDVREGRGADRGDRRGALALSRLCLDTSAYSRFKRGDPQAVELIDGADWLGIPTIVLGELSVGFLAGERSGRNEDELAAFLGNPVVSVLEVDAEIARIYAEILISLRAAGTPLPTNDIWIAATAARSGATVLTYDQHFSAVQRVGAIVLS